MDHIQKILTSQNTDKSRFEQIADNLDLTLSVTKFLTVNERNSLRLVCKQFSSIDLAPVMHCNLLDLSNIFPT